MDLLPQAGASEARTFSTDTFHDTGKFLEAYQKKVLCDVTFVVDGQRISAHRIILLASSEYFEAMFAGELRERDQTEVTMNDVDADIFRQLTEYCYTGSIKIHRGNIETLMRAADMFRFTKVKQFCSDFYSTILCSSNCLAIWELADLYILVQLKEAARNVVLYHFMEVSKSVEFCELDVQSLSALLADDGLHVSSEEDAFNTLMRWVKYDLEKRKESLRDLLKCIRFKLVQETFLLSEAKRESVEINFPELLALIADRRSSEDQIETCRSPTIQFHLISDVKSGIEIDKYCPRQNQWTKDREIDLKVVFFSVIHRDGKLILIGGRDEQKHILNTVRSIDLSTNKISSLPAMISSRFLPVSELVNDMLYVFGGFTDIEGDEIPRTVERFNFQTKEWTEVAPMAFARRRIAHAVLSGRLFIIGGMDKDDYDYNSVQCFVPSSNEWQTVAPMHYKRYGAAACASRGFIYVVGGWGEVDWLSSVERYDPCQNSWTMMKIVLPNPGFYCFAGVISVDDDLIYLNKGLAFYKVNVVTGEAIELKGFPRASRYHMIKC